MEDITLDFGAITIDNCVLKGEGYKFTEGLLRQMEQFEKSPVKVIQSDIIHNEAKKHIAENIKEARSSIDQAFRSAAKQLNISKKQLVMAAELLTLPGTDLEVAERRLQDYYARIGAEILSSNAYLDCEKLMTLYFSTKPPFEGAKEKKNEFPDAIALVSLEKWAERNNVNIIAVSNDKGWKDFAEHSKYITVIDTLKEALIKFQPHNQVNNIIKYIRVAAVLERPNVVLRELTKAIKHSQAHAKLRIHADSEFIFQVLDSGIYYIDHELLLDYDNLVAVNVLRIEGNVIVLQVSAEVTCEVTAKFGFYADIDYRMESEIGITFEKRKVTYTTDILISLTGDFSQESFENIKVTDIEVVETIDDVFFGIIKPEWSEYEPDWSEYEGYNINYPEKV